MLFQLGGQLAEFLAPTVKRLDKVHALANAIENLIIFETCLPRLRAAWISLQFVLNRALDF